jgi:hypothetical protein
LRSEASSTAFGLVDRLRPVTARNEGYDQLIGTNQAPIIEGSVMADKSPRQAMSKKSGQTLKQKRADKRSKAEHDSSTIDMTNAKKR